MAEGERRALILTTAGVVLALGGVAALVWTAPTLARRAVHAPTSGQVAWSGDNTDPAAVDAFVDQALARVGASDILGRSEEDGVVHGIYRLPQGADPDDAARRLRDQARDAGMEMYAAKVDGLDIEVRAYAGRDLRQKLLLVPRLGPPPRPSKGQEPFPIAIIAAGLGGADDDAILASTAPLSVAIVPNSPFALRVAQRAARAHHEVLADLRGQDEIRLEALQSMPYVSGALVDHPPSSPLSGRPYDVLVYPASETPGRVQVELRLLPAQESDRRSVSETLLRTRHLAASQGVAALVIEHDSPGLPEAIGWLQRSASDGYRAVLASEAARTPKRSNREAQSAETRKW